MKRVKRALEIKEELDLSHAKVAELAGVSPNALSMWAQGRRKPKKSSLRKIQKFIDEYEAGTLDLPQPMQEPTASKEITDPKVKVMYELIYKLEDKYDGKLSNVPEDDPVLQVLRKEVGVI